MTKIEDAQNAVLAFLSKILGTQDIKVTKVIKKGEKWQAEAEVYEESAFIKSIGLPTRVKDKNTYTVILNEDGEVESYGKKESLET